MLNPVTLPRSFSTFGKVGRRLLRPLRLFALWQSSDPYVQLLAAAAQATLKGALTADERDWVQRIEGLRRQLDTSTRTLERIDYGSGLRASGGTAPGSSGGVERVDQVQPISRFSSKNGLWASFLFRLVRSFKPERCLEMGTALGLSAAYQGAALTLNGRGKLVTLEGSPELAELARQNWESLGLSSGDGSNNLLEVVIGPFSETLAREAARLAPLDYVFVDGHHDEAATLQYLETLLPHLASPALLVFDDITWSAGMQRAWHAIAHHPRIKRAVDFGPLGVCVTGNMAKQAPLHAALA